MQDRASKQIEAAWQQAAAAIASMLELGTPRGQVTDRLGVPLRNVKKP